MTGLHVLLLLSVRWPADSDGQQTPAGWVGEGATSGNSNMNLAPTASHHGNASYFQLFVVNIFI